MSEEDTNKISSEDLIADLKHRADVLGIKYHPNIGVDKLSAKIKVAVEAQEKSADESDKSEETSEPATAESEAKVSTKKSAAPAKEAELSPEMKAKREKAHQKNRALELVRIRVTCMDPSKKEYEGEIFCAGNSLVGTVKKYVPFGASWHVPRIILNMIKAKKFQTFITRKTEKGRVREGKLVPTYAIEYLDALTPAELKELKQRQLMAAGNQDQV